MSWWNDLVAFRAAVIYCMRMARIEKICGRPASASRFVRGAREWHRILRRVGRSIPERTGD